MKPGQSTRASRALDPVYSQALWSTATAHTFRLKLFVAGISERRVDGPLRVERALLATPAAKKCNSAMRCVLRRSRYIANCGRQWLLSAATAGGVQVTRHGTRSAPNLEIERSFRELASGFKEGRSFHEQVRLFAIDVFPCAALLTPECPSSTKALFYLNVLRHVLESITDSPEWQTTIQMCYVDRTTKQPIRRRPRERGAGGSQPSLSSVLRSLRPRLRQLPTRKKCRPHVAAVNTGGKRAIFMFSKGVTCESGEPDVTSYDSVLNTDHSNIRICEMRITITPTECLPGAICALHCTRSLRGFVGNPSFNNRLSAASECAGLSP